VHPPRVSSVRALIVGAVIVASTVPAAAQTAPAQRDPDSFIQRQRALERRLRSEFEAELSAAQRAAFDWGGWYGLHVFMFDDGAESSRTFRRHDLRLWGRASLENGAHDFYARTRLSVLDFNSGDSYDGDDHDVEGPNLERGTYRFDLRRAVLADGGAWIDSNIEVLAGRDLAHWGTGLVLSWPLDQIAVRGTVRDFELTGMFGRTVGSAEDFDLSRTANRMRRDFMGGQLTHRGFERHEPFVYALWQRDRNDEEFGWPVRDLDYDSLYLAIGSTGEVAKGFRYVAEAAYEAGTSHTGRLLEPENEIDAWALGLELEYLFASKRRTRASVEYLFGSGDGDRLDSPTDTLGRRTPGSQDTSFVGFGYRNTGLSFAPRYSNLHLWRAGASCFPWPEHPRLRNLELGADWLLYQKHHASGAVSDPTADIQSGYLGWEMDYYANWRVDADFAWTARFGAFFPGKAFSDRTTRTFLLVGMTWSF